jgi:DNA-binding CsgD family transcriptional regulator
MKIHRDAVADLAAWPGDALTRREIEILTWIARGKSNVDIAQILGISPHTVDTYCRRVMSKLDTSSRTTAAVRASQHGLLPRI